MQSQFPLRAARAASRTLPRNLAQRTNRTFTSSPVVAMKNWAAMMPPPTDKKTIQSGKMVQDHSLPADGVPESEQTAADVNWPHMFTLKDKTIAITGGGRGVGIALAEAVADAGGNVACLDVLEKPAPKEWQRLQRMCEESGVTCSYHRIDITNEEQVSTIFDKIADEGKAANAPFWGMINCAGIQQRLAFTDYPVEDFNRIMAVNVTGAFLTGKHAARIFIENGYHGSIVLIASMSGQIANRGLHCSAYNTSKSAVHQLSRSMAQELGQHGIRVNTLSPGYIRTAMTDQLLEVEPSLEETWMRGAMLGRLGAPEDFKAPAIFLLSKGSSWMTGADLRVDGGHTAAA